MRLILYFLTVLFTYTTGWRYNILTGQCYIIISLVLSNFYYFIKKENLSHLSNFLVAVSATSLILLKPTALLIFFPFVLFPKQYFSLAATTLLILFIYAFYSYSTPTLHTNWSEYFSSLKEHKAMHRVNLETKSDMPNYSKKMPTLATPLISYEGILPDYDQPNKIKDLVMRSNECGSLYYTYRLFLKKQISDNVLLILEIVGILLLILPIFLIVKTGNNLPLEKLLLLGFCLYRWTEFLIPIPMGLYQWTTWLCPLLIFITQKKKVAEWSSILVLIGFTLNLLFMPLLPMKHTIGQFIILGGFLLFVYQNLLPEKILGIKI